MGFFTKARRHALRASKISSADNAGFVALFGQLDLGDRTAAQGGQLGFVACANGQKK
jgi:hypothetical protein